jgi:hypothetical protein
VKLRTATTVCITLLVLLAVLQLAPVIVAAFLFNESWSIEAQNSMRLLHWVGSAVRFLFSLSLLNFFIVFRKKL